MHKQANIQRIIRKAGQFEQLLTDTVTAVYPLLRILSSKL